MAPSSSIKRRWILFHFYKETTALYVNSLLCKGSLSYRSIFVYIFCLINICLSLSDEANKIKSLNVEKNITISIISKKLSLIYLIVSEKFSFKNSKQKMYDSVTFLPTKHFAVFDGWYFHPYCLQRAQVNQLFQLLNLVRKYGHGFYELSRTIMRKKKQWDQQNKKMKSTKVQWEGEKREPLASLQLHFLTRSAVFYSTHACILYYSIENRPCWRTIEAVN